MTFFRLQMVCALSLVGLVTACGGEVAPQDVQGEHTTAPDALMMEDPCWDGICGGGGGTGGGTGGGSTPAPYKLTVSIQPDGTDSRDVYWVVRRWKARSLFKTATGNKTDADHQWIHCYVNSETNYVDKDYDDDDESLTISFPAGAPRGAWVVAHCNHKTVDRGVTYTARTEVAYWND
ncbi:hypothetical protein [Corallococcus macrosporus]|uniref:hypothetical protein n=1 Tax=Corallococcus macrosporus TaxID=35 RepID=UPI0011D24168|nr:hypothetical protein [Corallococcus macrosporus]